MKSSHRPNSKPTRVKMVYFCQVDDCKSKLSNCKPYCVRYRVCQAHLQASSVQLQGAECRFCQQCGKFHALDEFDGNKRSCRSRLMHHNNSRMQRRKEVQKQLSSATSQLLELQQRRILRMKCCSSIDAGVLAAVDDEAAVGEALGNTDAEGAHKRNSSDGTCVDASSSHDTDDYSSTKGCKQQQQEAQQEAQQQQLHAGSNGSREPSPLPAVQQQWLGRAAGCAGGDADAPSSITLNSQQQQVAAWLQGTTAAPPAGAAAGGFQDGSHSVLDDVLAAASSWHLSPDAGFPASIAPNHTSPPAARSCEGSPRMSHPMSHDLSPFLQQQQQQQMAALQGLGGGTTHQAAAAAVLTDAEAMAATNSFGAAFNAGVHAYGASLLEPAGSATSIVTAPEDTTGGSSRTARTPVAAAAAGSPVTPTPQFGASSSGGCSGSRGVQNVLADNSCNTCYSHTPSSYNITRSGAATAGANAAAPAHLMCLAADSMQRPPYVQANGFMPSAAPAGSNASNTYMAGRCSYEGNAAAQGSHAWLQQQEQQGAMPGYNYNAAAVAAGHGCNDGYPGPADWQQYNETCQPWPSQAIQHQQYNLADMQYNAAADTPLHWRCSSLYGSYSQQLRKWQYMQYTDDVVAQHTAHSNHGSGIATCVPQPVLPSCTAGSLNSSMTATVTGSPGTTAGPVAAAAAAATVTSLAAAAATENALAAAGGAAHRDVWSMTFGYHQAARPLSGMHEVKDAAAVAVQQQSSIDRPAAATAAARSGPALPAIWLQQEQQQQQLRGFGSSGPDIALYECACFAANSAAPPAAQHAPGVNTCGGAVHRIRHPSLSGRGMQAARACHGSRCDGTFAAGFPTEYGCTSSKSFAARPVTCLPGDCTSTRCTLQFNIQQQQRKSMPAPLQHDTPAAATVATDESSLQDLYFARLSAVARRAVAQKQQLQLPHLLPREVVICSSTASTPTIGLGQSNEAGLTSWTQPGQLDMMQDSVGFASQALCSTDFAQSGSLCVTSPGLPISFTSQGLQTSFSSPASLPGTNRGLVSSESLKYAWLTEVHAPTAAASSYPQIRYTVTTATGSADGGGAIAAPSRPPSCQAIFMNGDSLGTAAQIDAMLEALGGDEAVAMDLGLL